MSDTTNENSNMTPQEQSREVLRTLTRIETLQKVGNNEFMEHKKDDRVHFDRLYDADEDLLEKFAQSTTEFKVFKTQVIYSIIGGMFVASAVASFIGTFFTAAKAVIGV